MLKHVFYYHQHTARLKSCPDTSCCFRWVLPQPLKASLLHSISTPRRAEGIIRSADERMAAVYSTHSGAKVNMKRMAANLWLWLFLAALCGSHFSLANAQFQPAENAASASSIPLNMLMQPQALNELLQKPTHESPLILQVGSHLLFAQAHIPGSEYAGPGSQLAGLDALRTRVAATPKDKLIVLYCGCCPWNRCPNIAPAYRMLHDAGFTNVKVLYLANNFGDDWVAKGYRVEKGRYGWADCAPSCAARRQANGRG